MEQALLEATQAYALREEGAGNGSGRGGGRTSQVLYDIFGLVLLTFVNEDVLSPATAVGWADACSSSSSSNGKATALFQEARTQKFVKWVRDLEAEESSSSGEEESSSEEEEEEDEGEEDEA